MSTPDLLAAVERALTDGFGQVPARASVSFVGVEPIEVLRFEPIPGGFTYVSLGMSRRPMSAPSEFVVSDDGPRAELLLDLRDPGGVFGEAWRRLALMAASPAVEGVVYVPGMSIDLGEPLAAGSRCTGAVITESGVEPVQTSDGRVDVLRVVPATAAELAWCRVHGAAALRERWAAQHVDLLDLGRAGAALD